MGPVYLSLLGLMCGDKSGGNLQSAHLSAGNNQKVLYGLCKSQSVNLLGPTCPEGYNSERAIACLGVLANMKLQGTF